MRVTRLTETRLQLFDENFPATAPRVPIFRKIHFRDLSILVGERTNALDHVESDVRNVLCTQPFQERPALKRNGQPPKLCHGKIRMCRITQLALDPFLFLSSYHCRSPNVLANVSAKRFLQIRNNSMSNAVAKWREIFVRSIFAKSQPVLPDVIVDLFAPDAKKRPHDR